MIGIAVLACGVISAATFYAGTRYQASMQPSLGNGQFEGNFQNGRTGNRMIGPGTGASGATRSGFRPVNGEIISVDDKSAVVKLQDGSTKIVLISEKTNINKAEKAAIADLKVGETVSVFGTQNTDGSVSAQNIQLNPQRYPTPPPESQ